jgi:cytochrome c556
MHRVFARALAALAVSAATISLAGAAALPEDAIKYRKVVMTAMAGHIAAISLVFAGKVDNRQHLINHAEALANIGEEMSSLFPAGSGTGKTDALPAIWQEPEKFRQAVEAGRSATAQLRDAINSGDKAAIGKGLKAVGDGCKGCHDKFRKEDDGG